MTGIGRGVALSALSTAIAIAAGGGTAQAGYKGGAPPLQIVWTIDGGAGNEVQPGWTKIGDVVSYTGQDVDSATGVLLGYDLDLIGGSWVVATMTINNTLSRPIFVRLDVIVPVTTPLSDSLLQGQAVVGLTAGADGGVVASQPPAVWQARADRFPAGPASTLFFHPFEVTLSGPSGASVYSDFGQQVPVAGPAMLESMGYSLRFTLTSQDQGAFYCNFEVVGGTPLCLADIDGDGTVGIQDLVQLLAAWNQPGDDIPDLDGDDEVGINDLLLLLGAWGDCP